MGLPVLFLRISSHAAGGAQCRGFLCWILMGVEPLNPQYGSSLGRLFAETQISQSTERTCSLTLCVSDFKVEEAV